MLRAVIPLTALLCAIEAQAGDQDIIENGKAAVAAKLINPESARFTDVRMTSKNGQQFICGLVEAKNGKGEYDPPKNFVFIVADKGRHPVIIYGGRSITHDLFSNLAQPEAFNDMCSR
jgi:hypothetical protein